MTTKTKTKTKMKKTYEYKEVDNSINNKAKSKKKGSSSAAAQNVNNINIKITSPPEMKKKKRRKSNGAKKKALEELEESINTFDEIKDMAKSNNIKIPPEIGEVGDISNVKSVEDIKNLNQVLKNKITQISQLIQQGASQAQAARPQMVRPQLFNTPSPMPPIPPFMGNIQNIPQPGFYLPNAPNPQGYNNLIPLRPPQLRPQADNSEFILPTEIIPQELSVKPGVDEFIEEEVDNTTLNDKILIKKNEMSKIIDSLDSIDTRSKAMKSRTKLRKFIKNLNLFIKNNNLEDNIELGQMIMVLNNIELVLKERINMDYYELGNLNNREKLDIEINNILQNELQNRGNLTQELQPTPPEIDPNDNFEISEEILLSNKSKLLQILNMLEYKQLIAYDIRDVNGAVNKYIVNLHIYIKIIQDLLKKGNISNKEYDDVLNNIPYLQTPVGLDIAILNYEVESGNNVNNSQNPQLKLDNNNMYSLVLNNKRVPNYKFSINGELLG
jgi:hypothetical protein